MIKYLLIAWLVAANLHAAEITPELAEFKSRFEQAFTKKDLKLLNALVYQKGADTYAIDEAVYRYESNWDDYRLDKIEFKSGSDPIYAPFGKNYDVTMNGHQYVTNLRPEYFCQIDFSGKDGKNKMGFISPIGKAPDGTYKFILSVRKP